jgi:L-alanine-DL-glutamate epimerase-like enolase superfamily enzyme
MAKQTDITTTSSSLYFLPVELRLPLKFGAEAVNHIDFGRASLTVSDALGKTATGWGETPLSATWAWPSKLTIRARVEAMQEFCRRLAAEWAEYPVSGHPMEIGHAFLENRLPQLLGDFNRERGGEDMPLLAALVCNSLFDIALHDAYGNLHGVPVYETYNKKYMTLDLSEFIEPAEGASVSFKGKYPQDFFAPNKPTKLPAWHLVGGLDLLDETQLTGKEPKDGYPVILTEWMKTDGLKCLKVKLRGNDQDWDYQRLVAVGKIAQSYGDCWLTSDFNCMVTEPAYVNEILDRLVLEQPRIYGMLMYVEQPFPYELEENKIDVHSVSARKPLFMDESAHDWKFVRMGRELGWTGVALKTCKTQTGALLSLCWAKAHGMTLMVQDLTNAMLAQVPHVLLAQHAGTIMGVEVNGMQFYPAASAAEAKVHPGLYKRNGGCLDLSTIKGTGFGYRLDEIERELPEAATRF